MHQSMSGAMTNAIVNSAIKEFKGGKMGERGHVLDDVPLRAEDIKEINTIKRKKQNKINKEKKKMDKNKKLDKDAFVVYDVRHMGTFKILWFLVKRHKFVIVVLALIIVSTHDMVTNLPVAISNFK